MGQQAYFSSISLDFISTFLLGKSSKSHVVTGELKYLIAFLSLRHTYLRTASVFNLYVNLYSTSSSIISLSPSFPITRAVNFIS